METTGKRRFVFFLLHLLPVPQLRSTPLKLGIRRLPSQVEYEVIQHLRVCGSRRGIHDGVEVGLGKGHHLEGLVTSGAV